METNFTESVYNAACTVMGEAVWQLVITKQEVSKKIINMMLELSEHHRILAESVALSVLNDT